MRVCVPVGGVDEGHVDGVEALHKVEAMHIRECVDICMKEVVQVCVDEVMA